MFRHIGKDELALDWWRIGKALAPAVEYDPNGVSLEALKGKLMSGQCTCLEVQVPHARGYLVYELFGDGTVKCFASYIAGITELPPKAWLRTMRGIMADFEHRLIEAGCSENYIGGRDWSRVFPDYSPADGVPNRLKKVLQHG